MKKAMAVRFTFSRSVPSVLVFLFMLSAAIPPLAAQDFGFGSIDTDGVGGFGGGSPLTVSIGGEIQASLVGFVEEFRDGAEHTRLGDIFSGKLNFTADTSHVRGVINFGLRTSDNPITIDEAYLSGFFGILDLTTGLRKLAWGRADVMSPLDVINPMDFSDLTDLSDMMSLKIARPLIHASLRFGQFSRLEGVFVPNFAPARFAENGRWEPPQLAALSQLPPGFVIRPDTTTLNYAQAGVRFTTTIGGVADIGIQYYYGRLTNPAITQTFTDPMLPPVITFAYNPYHQIGIDWAQVLFGFNIRAELAGNITTDLDGTDGAIYNPSLAWSLGFDRDLFWGINLNIQCNETIRLLDSKISDPYDIEADSDIMSTLIIASLSKKFMRDELEVRAAALWEVESGACLIMPGITWTRNDVAIELSAGIFAGNNEGLFGQFRDNSFLKVGIKYTF